MSPSKAVDKQAFFSDLVDRPLCFLGPALLPCAKSPISSEHGAVPRYPWDLGKTGHVKALRCCRLSGKEAHNSVDVYMPTSYGYTAGRFISLASGERGSKDVRGCVAEHAARMPGIGVSQCCVSLWTWTSRQSMQEKAR